MFLLDVLLIASGVFLLVYGGRLFRFALAVGAFVLGFSLAMWLLSSQPVAVRLLVSLVAGGIIAIVGYMLVKMVPHFAGAILGAMLAMFVLSLFPISLPTFLSLIVVAANAGVSWLLRQPPGSLGDHPGDHAFGRLCDIIRLGPSFSFCFWNWPGLSVCLQTICRNCQ